jgi:lipopolysaccharide/colanic/teichoic acid biosynthesis glycosyltransferase
LLIESRDLNKKLSCFYKKRGKRIFDLIVVVPAIIFLLPLKFLISLLIKIESSGPVIYKQKRIGENTNYFYIYKFRTMVNNADKIGPSSTQKGDPRITRVGFFLRKYSLDELPQLFNVLLGNMSLVGFRPGVEENYSKEDLKNAFLFSIKPGITGYAQINGRSNITLESKRYWELKYINDLSFILDLEILLKTFLVVIKAGNSN